ncbi:type III pantothenate kinase [Flavobacterium palustre]|uniref:type III pantothenate kinase n=1 Tax=Flavobacterium palustre TaxID=1476463 RepID=UPI00360B32B0
MRIDAGTCVTYDFVDENNVYQVVQFLRECDCGRNPCITLQQNCHCDSGKSESMWEITTQEAIHSGVVNGLVYEIDGFIDEYKAACKNIIKF